MIRAHMTVCHFRNVSKMLGGDFLYHLFLYLRLFVIDSVRFRIPYAIQAQLNQNTFSLNNDIIIQPHIVADL